MEIFRCHFLIQLPIIMITLSKLILKVAWCFLAELRLVILFFPLMILWFPLIIFNYCPVYIVDFICFLYEQVELLILVRIFDISGVRELFQASFVQVESLLKLLLTFLKGMRFFLICIYVVHIVCVLSFP